MSRRILALAALVAALPFGAAQAATPANGSITPDSRLLEFTGGPYVFPNVTSQTEITDVIGDPVCEPGTPVCDTFDLTLDLPEDFYTTNPTDLVKFKMTWEGATGQEDYDFYLYDAEGNQVAMGPGTTNPENMLICAGEGVQDYRVVIIPWNAVGATYKVEVEMTTEVKSKCKDPSPGTKARSGGQMGGALGLGLLLPLFALGLRRRKP